MKTTPSHINQPTIESLQAQVEELTAKVRWYEEQFRLSQQKRFGTSSEKTPNNQLALELFNEAEKESACRKCELAEVSTPIVTAKMPAPAFPKSIASPSIMAYIMTQKYVEGLPLYRQEKHFERMGIFLSRQTMGNWLLYGADR